MAEVESAHVTDGQGGDEGGKKKKKKNKNAMIYGTYLHEIVKKKAPDHKIAAKSMYALNSIVLDIQKRLCDESVKIAKFHKKSTLASTHVHAATKILFNGQLSGNAVAEGMGAVEKYKEAEKAEKAEKADKADKAD